VDYPYGETIAIVSQTVSGQDDDGNDTRVASETSISGVAFAPAGSTELVQGQDTVITQDTVYLPTGASLPLATDKVRARGRLYNIEGDPQVFVNPFTGEAPGAVLRLSKVT
jgi:hypothetical protein